MRLCTQYLPERAESAATHAAILQATWHSVNAFCSFMEGQGVVGAVVDPCHNTGHITL